MSHSPLARAVTLVALFTLAGSENSSSNILSSTSRCKANCDIRGGSSGSLFDGKDSGSALLSSDEAPSVDTANSGRSMIRLVFSDVDGTLVHYPDQSDAAASDNSILHLPPSSTGMRGIISSRTLQLTQRLRREHGTKLVLVSGMRTSTLLKRLPYLPRADAYACEAGGRIFYPVDLSSNKDTKDYSGIVIYPVAYDGATEDDLSPFGIAEDAEWKSRMERVGAAGKDGFEGNDGIRLEDRRGALWTFARLLTSEGFVIDWKGYATCFRVNRKQQADEVDDSKFESLLLSSPPEGLATSVNLGCVDFYPSESGKRNCCEYLAKKLLGDMDVPTVAGEQEKNLLSTIAVCLCDDDNDLEMALACHHAFVPSVTSSSMADAVKANPDQITVTAGNAVETKATEAALERIIEMLAV